MPCLRASRHLPGLRVARYDETSRKRNSSASGMSNKRGRSGSARFFHKHMRKTQIGRAFSRHRALETTAGSGAVCKVPQSKQRSPAMSTRVSFACAFPIPATATSASARRIRQGHTSAFDHASTCCATGNTADTPGDTREETHEKASASDSGNIPSERDADIPAARVYVRL